MNLEMMEMCSINIIELAATLAEKATEKKWKDDQRKENILIEISNGDSRYNEDAQEIFNQYYDEYYTQIEKLSINVKDFEVDEEEVISKEIGKDLIQHITSKISDYAESHLEAWKERYRKHGGNRDAVEEDVRINHDDSLEIERVEEALKRELNDEEKSYFSSQFAGDVLLQWENGNLN